MPARRDPPRFPLLAAWPARVPAEALARGEAELLRRVPVLLHVERPAAVLVERVLHADRVERLGVRVAVAERPRLLGRVGQVEHRELGRRERVVARRGLAQLDADLPEVPGNTCEVICGDGVAVTAWIFNGNGSRRRRGYDV